MGRPLLLDSTFDTRVAISVAGVGLRLHWMSGAILAQPRRPVFAQPASRFPMAFHADGPAWTCVLCGLLFGSHKSKLERHLNGREHARAVREQAGLTRRKGNIERSMRSKKSEVTVFVSLVRKSVFLLSCPIRVTNGQPCWLSPSSAGPVASSSAT